MDTSISQPEQASIAIPLEQLLFDGGEKCVSLLGYPSETWVNLLRKMIAQCESTLPYFHRLSPLRQTHFVYRTYTDFLHHSFFHENLSPSTRMVLVYGFPVERKEKDFFIERELFVSESGDFVLVTATLQEIKDRRQTVGVRIAFSVLDDEALAEMINSRRTIVSSIVQVFGEILEEGIGRREQQLQKLKDAERVVSRFRRMIRVDARCGACAHVTSPLIGTQCPNCGASHL